MRLTKDFSLDQLLPPGVSASDEHVEALKAIARNLQVLRDDLGREVRVLSGLRTRAGNLAAGGAEASQHLAARAVDLVVPGMAPWRVAERMEQLVRERRLSAGGLGVYPQHVHYDLRPEPRTWYSARLPAAMRTLRGPAEVLPSGVAGALAGGSLFDGGRWRFPVKDGTILVWFGANYAGGAEKDQSVGMTAETLAETLAALADAGALGKIDVQVFRGEDKDVLFDRLDAADAGSVIQVHYLGHGNGGGLFSAYRHPAHQRARSALSTRLDRLEAGGSSAADLRVVALKGEPSFMTGLLDIEAYRKRAARALHPKAFVQLWGCFSGAGDHTFDRGYWSRFATGETTPSVSVHVARALGVPVIASRDPKGVHGNNFWYRRKKGGKLVVGQSDEARRIYRPNAIPQWLWPAKGAEWVTRDPKGAELHTEPGGPPPAALTDLVAGQTRLGRRARAAHRAP